MSSTVDQIKERLSIADVVGAYVTLEKAGASLKAKCPFHNEKTPSFFVSPARGSYYCFGCGAKGDIFTFVQEFEGLDFRGALKSLADRAGVKIVEENKKDRDLRERMFSVMEEATKFFVKQLATNGKVLQYLKSRGLNEKTINDWRIGFAPDGWRNSLEYLRGLGFSDKEIETVGLSKSQDGKVYDRFRSRIMFPIFDSAGRVVAFSGRIFGEEGKDLAKYLNSPETPLFSKSRILFGFDRAKSEMRRLNYAILVEGQMDLLMSHQAGYKNTVASSGTALTESQVGLIGRMTKRIMMVYDADKAGVAASLRGAALALSLGMEIKVAALPEGFDPADMILKDEKKWRDCLKNSKHLIDFYLEKVLSEKGKDERSVLRELREKVLPYVAALESKIEQAHFVKKIAEQAKIGESSVSSDLEKTKAAFELKEKDGKTEQAESYDSSENHAKSMVLGVILWQRSSGKKNPSFASFEERVKEVLGEKVFSEELKKAEKNNTDIVFKVESYYGGREDLARDFDELVLNFEEDLIKEQLKMAMKELSDAEAEKNDATGRKAMEKCRDLAKKLDNLKRSRRL